MPVQRQAIPYLLAGRDLMVQSRTGSGKTGAFVLPILHRVDPRVRQCQALVLVPTRELAKQVEREAAILAGDAGVRTVAVYGGAAYGPQLAAFEAGAHVVVGTPGRVLDHLLRRSLVLDQLQFLVLDEADRMLSMGFYPDMQRVSSYLPRRAVSSYMFSATFPDHVMRLARAFLRRPQILSLSRDHVHVTDTVHVYHMVDPAQRDRALVRILEAENPTAAIVFCNTKRHTHYLAVVLQRFGWDADALSADLGQGERERVLQRVRDGRLRVLVATDVAGRGIDIPDLSHVIQYEPPLDVEAYVHRAGRTGRAGASGRAITLAAEGTMDRAMLHQIADRFSIDLQERPMPTDDDVADLIGQRVTARLEAELRTRGQLERARLERFLPLARSLGEVDDEAVLLAMLLDDYYQRTLATPPVERAQTQTPPRPQPASDASAPSAPASPRQERPADEASPRRRRGRRGGGRSRSGGG